VPVGPSLNLPVASRSETSSRRASGPLFGPLAPARYRLDGPGSLPQAEALLGAALEDFGPSPATPQQIATLRMVADALADPSLVQIAEQLAAAQASIPRVSLSS
jgi:hypothetical protein